jgi:hypothetical protein
VAGPSCVHDTSHRWKLSWERDVTLVRQLSSAEANPRQADKQGQQLRGNVLQWHHHGGEETEAQREEMACLVLVIHCHTAG